MATLKKLLFWKRDATSANAPFGTFDLEEFRRDLFALRAKSPEFYKNEVDPHLNAWKTHYGHFVPLKELQNLLGWIRKDKNFDAYAALRAHIGTKPGPETGRSDSSRFFNLDEFQRRLDPLRQENPNFYEHDVSPLLDGLRTKYGNRIPVEELEKLDQWVGTQESRIREQLQGTLEANGVKTLPIAELRARLEKTKAEYKGSDREEFAQKVDKRLEFLTAKYGAEIPLDEVMRDAFRVNPGDELTLDWSTQPGFHERHLHRRLNNPFFPPERRVVTRHELESAKELDTQMFMMSVEAAALSVALFKSGHQFSVKDLQELNKTITNACGLGPRAVNLVAELREYYRKGFDALEELTFSVNKDERAREQRYATRQQFELLNKQAQNLTWIDFSRVPPPDRMPTLLSSDVADLRLILVDLPPGELFSDLSKGPALLREQLRNFAAQLMRDSSEARAKLESEPEKLAFVNSL